MELSILEIDLDVAKRVSEEDVFEVVYSMRNELLGMNVGEEILVEIGDLAIIVERTEKGLSVSKCLEVF
ncbi:hypothetical protein [Anoxybacillus sp. TBDG-1]